MNCLLCDTGEVRIVSEISGRELRQLFTAAGRGLSEAAYGTLTSERSIQLFECPACGFQFFDPSLAGAGQFYEELEESTYYPPNRPEFEFALRFAGAHAASRVLDVGGGAGAFLDLAKARGLTTYGMELNERAASDAAQKGHLMFVEPAGQLDPEKLGGPVDLITLFQVVEHVPDPRAFVRELLKLVKVGGYLIVSVPNRDGLFRLLPYDPANMPPHHISRWRRQDLEHLGEACGLRVLTVGSDVLFGGDLEIFWLLHNRLAGAIGRRPWPGGTWLPKLVSFVYRKLGCRHYLPGRGLSIYAVFQRCE